jgi:sugar/nucleoside kinase (ribokinase family)
MFLPGRLLELGPVSFCTGGPVSNVGLVLHKLGLTTQLMGKVGDDLFGRAVKQIISRSGADLIGGMVVDQGVATSYTLVINPPGMDRILLHCPGANDAFTADDVNYDLASRVRLFHFGYPPLMKRMYEQGGAELVELFRRVKETGVTTVLDMALPDPSSAAGQADWHSILAAILPYVDIFLPSIEEILYMVRAESYDRLYEAANGPNFLPLIKPELLSEIGQSLLELGTRVVCLKLGERGLYLRTGNRQTLEAMGRARPSDAARWANQELWTACFQVQEVGTVGSGDATIAGFLSGWLRALSPEEALTAAVAVGACNVEGPDALSGIQPWQQTLDRIAQGWPKHPLILDSHGWRFDAHHQLWRKGS